MTYCHGFWQRVHLRASACGTGQGRLKPDRLRDAAHLGINRQTGAPRPRWGPTAISRPGVAPAPSPDEVQHCAPARRADAGVRMNSKISRVVVRASRRVRGALALVAGAVATPLRPTRRRRFPFHQSWIIAGALGQLVHPSGQFVRCVGSGQPRGRRPASPRVPQAFGSCIDRVAESRPGFGGYRIYRMVSSPVRTTPCSCDASRSIRAARRRGPSRGSTARRQLSLQRTRSCDGIVTFVDPDSERFVAKVCRRRDFSNRCLSVGDSVFALIAPRPARRLQTWYSITYEAEHDGPGLRGPVRSGHARRLRAAALHRRPQRART